MYIFLHPIHHRAPVQLNHYQADKYWEKPLRYLVDRHLLTWIALLLVFTWRHLNSNYRTIDRTDILLSRCIRAAEN